MMNRQRYFWWVLSLAAWHPADMEAADDGVFTEVLRPVFQQSCVKCHGKEGKVKGKMNLLRIGGVADLVSAPLDCNQTLALLIITHSRIYQGLVEQR